MLIWEYIVIQIVSLSNLSLFFLAYLLFVSDWQNALFPIAAPFLQYVSNQSFLKKASIRLKLLSGLKAYQAEDIKMSLY